MKKQLITAGIATAVGVSGLVGATVANAATETTSSDPMSSLVKAVAIKFNLNQADVQAVFDEQHEKMETEHENHIKTQIDQLVVNGKLTQQQADKLIAKRAELEKERETFNDSGKTREERRSEMQAKRAELDSWAKDNGIEINYLHYVIAGEHHGRHGMDGLHDMGPDDDTN